MSYNLDDWWQTPLADRGMELRDLIREGLKSLQNRLKEENKLDQKTRDSITHILKVVDTEYTKLTK